jgi:hypothetical protein
LVFFLSLWIIKNPIEIIARKKVQNPVPAPNELA